MIGVCSCCGSRQLLPVLVWEKMDDPHIASVECLTCGDIRALGRPERRRVTAEEAERDDAGPGGEDAPLSRKAEKRGQRREYAAESAGGKERRRG